MNNSRCAIHHAIRKYGIENFIFETLFHCISKNNMDQKEKETIKAMNSKRPRGYNLTNGGEGSFGYKHTEKAKTRISVAHKGRKMTADEIEKRKKSHPHRKLTIKERARISIYNKGRKMSDKCKAILLKTHLGAKHSDETKAKMRVARKGEKPNLGKKATPETRLKLSLAQKVIITILEVNAPMR